MIDKPVKIGNDELYNARVLNISVAQYYGVVKEYSEMLSRLRRINKRKLDKHKELAELQLYLSIRKHLNKLVKEKIEEYEVD
jgi:hypothetical protein